jgi:hypothetical protein
MTLSRLNQRLNPICGAFMHTPPQPEVYRFLVPTGNDRTEFFRHPCHDLGIKDGAAIIYDPLSLPFEHHFGIFFV